MLREVQSPITKNWCLFLKYNLKLTFYAVKDFVAKCPSVPVFNYNQSHVKLVYSERPEEL